VVEPPMVVVDLAVTGLSPAPSPLAAAAMVASIAAISKAPIIVPEPARWPVEGERSSIAAVNP
jgi:hypothetical protein